MKKVLEVIFQQYFFKNNHADELTGPIVEAMVDEYLQTLSAQGVHIPLALKPIFLGELREEIREMAITHISGVKVKIDEKSTLYADPKEIENDPQLRRFTRRVA